MNHRATNPSITNQEIGSPPYHADRNPPGPTKVHRIGKALEVTRLDPKLSRTPYANRGVFRHRLIELHILDPGLSFDLLNHLEIFHQLVSRLVDIPSPQSEK